MDSIRESAPKVVQNDVKWDRESMDSIRENAPEVVQNDVRNILRQNIFFVAQKSFIRAGIYYYSQVKKYFATKYLFLLRKKVSSGPDLLIQPGREGGREEKEKERAAEK